MCPQHRSLFTAVLLLATLSGCAANKPYLRPARYAEPVSVAGADVSPAECSYARALELDERDSQECVSWYLLTAQQLWPQVISGLAESRESQLYRSAVGRLVEASQRFDALDLERATLRHQAEGTGRQASVRLVGFAWEPSEFGHIQVVGEYNAGEDVRPIRQEGIGVPILIHIETDRSYVYSDEVKPATAVVRTDDNGIASLDIVNTTTVRHTRVVRPSEKTARSEEHWVPIAFDLTAPLAYFAIKESEENPWLRGFFRPGEDIKDVGLTMIDPYEPGKIPVVFVHGLASDPMTWASMANELFAHDDIIDKYQFWIFSYPTGTPFTLEAANLRRQLVEIRNHFDPEHRNATLDQMVLIGHSMGGLVSKLQITSSGNRLVESVFAKPIHELDVPVQMQEQFNETFFFEPSTSIRRVVFIGTPHRGASLASNPVGRLASTLIREPTQMVEEFSEFTRMNANAFAQPIKRVPTSVDLLRPGNELLEAIFRLPVNPNVALHSVIGTARGGRFGRERSDGVVPVSSAQHPGTESELLIDASHSLHHHPDTVSEVLRILRKHASTAGLTTVGNKHTPQP